MESIESIITSDTHEGAVHTLTLPPRRRDLRMILRALYLAAVASAFLAVALWMFWRSRFGAVWESSALALSSFGLFRQSVLLLFPDRATVEVTGPVLFAHARRRWGSTSIIPDTRAIVRLEIDEARGWRSWMLTPSVRLSAEFADGRRVLIADQYPRPVLEALAAALQPLLHRSRMFSGPAPDSATATGPAIVDVSAIPPLARDVLEPPPDCRILATAQEGAVRFVLPRWGAFHTRGRYIAFNVFALLLAALPVTVIVALYCTAPVNRPAGSGLVMAIAAVMLLPILGVMLAAFHFFRRRTVLIAGVSPSGERELISMSQGPLGSRERSWRSDQIRWISTMHRSSSFTVTSDSAAPRLWVYLRPTRGRRRILADGPELEMRWLATELRTLLGVSNLRGP